MSNAKEKLKEAAAIAHVVLEANADRLAEAGIRSPWGWCIYAVFFSAGFALGAWLL